MTSLAATASSKDGPFRNDRPSVIVQVAVLAHSGPANPSTPEPGPNSRSKISPVSSNTIADSPSGAVAFR